MTPESFRTGSYISCRTTWQKNLSSLENGIKLLLSYIVLYFITFILIEWVSLFCFDIIMLSIFQMFVYHKKTYLCGKLLPVCPLNVIQGDLYQADKSKCLFYLDERDDHLATSRIYVWTLTILFSNAIGSIKC